MSDDFEDGSLLDEMEKTPSISWRDAEIGQKLVLRIEELPSKKIQRKVFGGDDLMWWPQRDGQERRPMLNTFTRVTVLDGSDTWTKWAKKKQTDPAQVVGEVYNWWTNIPSQPLKALSDLNAWMKQNHNRGLKAGDVVSVTIADMKEIEGKPDYDLQKIFKIEHVRNESSEPSVFDE